jgi:hypothetical protein
MFQPAPPEALENCDFMCKLKFYFAVFKLNLTSSLKKSVNWCNSVGTASGTEVNEKMDVCIVDTDHQGKGNRQCGIGWSDLNRHLPKNGCEKVGEKVRCKCNTDGCNGSEAIRKSIEDTFNS